MSSRVDIEDVWQDSGLHWHAHRQTHSGPFRHRLQRRDVQPAAVLRSPEEVADWLGAEYRRHVSPDAIAVFNYGRLGAELETPNWFDDLQTGLRGDSICRVFPPRTPDHVGVLYADAWTAAECTTCSTSSWTGSSAFRRSAPMGAPLHLGQPQDDGRGQAAGVLSAGTH